MRFFFSPFWVSVLALTGCVTSEGKLRSETILHENEEVSAKLMIQSSKWLTLQLKNKSTNVLVVGGDGASFSHNGKNSKLVAEGTKHIDATRSQPPIIVAPKDFLSKSFATADSSDLINNEWVTRDWIPENLTQVSFVFQYKVNDVEKFIVFNGRDVSKENEKKVVGKVSANTWFINPLFLRSQSSRREILLSEAENEVRKIYGDQVIVTNPTFVGKWSPWSLLLYLSLLGFVEDASVTVDVVEK